MAVPLVIHCRFRLADVLVGFATVPLGSPSTEPRGQQLFLLSPGTDRKLPPAAAIAMEVRCLSEHSSLVGFFLKCRGRAGGGGRASE